jgi:hypothetical protein
MAATHRLIHSNEIMSKVRQMLAGSPRGGDIRGMTPPTSTRARTIAIVAAGLLGVGTLGCGVLSKAKNVVDNLSTISDYANKIQKADNLTFTADYKLSDGSTAQVVQKPPNSAYIGKDSRFIVTADSIYLCSTDQGKLSCTKSANTSGGTNGADLSGASSIGAGFVTPELAVAILIAASVSPNAHVDKSTQKIAGQNSSCIKVTNTKPDPNDPNDLKNFTVCITDQGILSKFAGKLTSGDDASIELTKFSTSADDNAFKPPAGAEIIDTTQPFPTVSPS